MNVVGPVVLLALAGCLACGSGSGSNASQGGGGSTPPPALVLSPTGGDSQTGPGGVPYLPLTVTATDGGNPAPGVTVTFSDGGAGGTFSDSTGITGSTGTVSTTYTPPLVSSPASIIISATSPGYSEATFLEHDNPGSQLCAHTYVEGPTEPPQPENSCATGVTKTGVFYPTPPWGELEIALCNMDGVPPLSPGLPPPSCVEQDPDFARVTLNESNASAALVDAPLDTNQGFVLNSCSNNGVADVTAKKTTDAEYDWKIMLTTPVFWYGNEPGPSYCNVLLSDQSGQAILVLVGYQISQYCSNATCTPTSGEWEPPNFQRKLLYRGSGDASLANQR